MSANTHPYEYAVSSLSQPLYVAFKGCDGHLGLPSGVLGFRYQVELLVKQPISFIHSFLSFCHMAATFQVLGIQPGSPPLSLHPLSSGSL